MPMMRTSEKTIRNLKNDDILINYYFAAVDHPLAVRLRKMGGIQELTGVRYFDIHGISPEEVEEIIKTIELSDKIVFDPHRMVQLVQEPLMPFMLGRIFIPQNPRKTIICKN